jgi:hypothetical protein
LSWHATGIHSGARPVDLRQRNEDQDPGGVTVVDDGSRVGVVVVLVGEASDA